MRTETRHEVLDAAPFRPFTLCLADGARVDVPDPRPHRPSSGGAYRGGHGPGWVHALHRPRARHEDRGRAAKPGRDDRRKPQRRGL